MLKWTSVFSSVFSSVFISVFISVFSSVFLSLKQNRKFCRDVEMFQKLCDRICIFMSCVYQRCWRCFMGSLTPDLTEGSSGCRWRLHSDDQCWVQIMEQLTEGFQETNTLCYKQQIHSLLTKALRVKWLIWTFSNLLAVLKLLHLRTFGLEQRSFVPAAAVKRSDNDTLNGSKNNCSFIIRLHFI